MIYILFTRLIYIDDISINLVFIEINRWLQSTTGLRVHIWRQVPRGHYKSSMVQGKHRNYGLEEVTQISMCFFRKIHHQYIEMSNHVPVFKNYSPQNNHIPTWEKQSHRLKKCRMGGEMLVPRRVFIAFNICRWFFEPPTPTCPSN